MPIGAAITAIQQATKELKLPASFSARALAAEFIGTFALIFIGAGAAIALGVNHDPPVAFAHGLTSAASE
jgi:glycerol uptake facilitator-like aquaporin